MKFEPRDFGGSNDLSSQNTSPEIRRVQFRCVELEQAGSVPIRHALHSPRNSVRICSLVKVVVPEPSEFRNASNRRIQASRDSVPSSLAGSLRRRCSLDSKRCSNSSCSAAESCSTAVSISVRLTLKPYTLQGGAANSPNSASSAADTDPGLGCEPAQARYLTPNRTPPAFPSPDRRRRGSADDVPLTGPTAKHPVQNIAPPWIPHRPHAAPHLRLGSGKR
jgi:hypothetical protein